ncbi:type IV pilin [Natronobacterium gregoryi]|uniref:Archaeal flagellin-like protein n=2 Tax=Natronobacterium gregoryi TaxID=44930 RepID=L0AJ39_NATGS|nr:type IV pilin N-terminal domain-containing protein [Natronobacterium gregoryi]AFZ73167.1 archaeal flagellin-like protein [Natronobacterium gregoryi SP2]ELY71107.1 flagellin domain-containing protein [Natronobacterium gregoryi SP2]PLK21578.1 type IV pilin [Natronobacterium gregoryi SP2]SFI59704.1 flagellin N-terminal-like domain-containing protein [Natronobacterium gregoryi]
MPGPAGVRLECRSGKRGVSPLVGVLALIAIVVCLATVVAVGVTSPSLESPAPNAAFDLVVNADRSEIALDHIAGDPIDVRELSLTIAVDGTDLADQPRIPFAGTEGFDGAPTGPFNVASDPYWQTGERASVTVADSNDPSFESGVSVTVSLAVDGQPVAELETTA